jgi:hypothetical protein
MIEGRKGKTMDYQYENLGPEHFQEICQSLLLKEFPRTQCFPVAQPDGGRDAIAYPLFYYTKENEFIVFQVKFVRDPNAIVDSHKWLTDILKEEAPKLKKLIPKGAREYFLITNVRGTAHPEVGSIDTAHRILNDALDIPAQCWWRLDLNRRLDNAFDLKWAHPEILTGPDMLRQIIKTGLTEDKDRRTSAIRAFIRDQYEKEREVRFKQVELQNNLFDLFIDVPIVLPKNPRRIHGMRILHAYTEHGHAPIGDYIVQDLMRTGEARANPEGDQVGAAAILLDRRLQTNIPCVVIEGAPGQGKSTIAQYVCQIHRSRILGEDFDKQSIPEYHLNNPIRLPMKMDLRDFSIWLSGKNPFSPDDPGRPKNWQKSLESFLAALVRNHSGGVDFSISDLHAVAKLSSLLIVLDGFDEIPSVDRRNAVVDQIVEGVQRLREISASLQIIVTSRPAAFASSPGLPEDVFCYFELGSVTKPLISEYATKWLRSKNLKGKEAKEIRGILDGKIEQPHLRELARNPMQLAILLSLIHTRGSSLPEKRTALYDSYVELFFNREAEKSSVVREHRELLIDIHRHVAWVMHAQAEMTDSPGSITTNDLHKLITKYLTVEQHDTSIGDKLFAGMVERIVALVSRVEGTFEFEVQPLREYFAARYLYDTAPYSPPGAEKSGTLPDRFDAIAKNSFWLNVTRFYAGCFSKGQLTTLVDRLEDLSRADGYRFTSMAQELSAILLSDWVFSQHPRSMRKVVKLISNPMSLRRTLLWTRSPRRTVTTMVLAKECGSEELVKDCLSVLESFPQRDYAEALLELIEANCDKEKITDYWLGKLHKVSASKRTKWIQYGAHLNCLSQQDTDSLDKILSDVPMDHDRINALLQSNQRKYFEEKEERLNSLVEDILNRNIRVSTFLQSSSVLQVLEQALNAQVYTYVSRNGGKIPLSIALRDMLKHPGYTELHILDIERVQHVPTYDFEHKSLEIAKTASRECEHSCAKWGSCIDPWNRIVEKARSMFGERWSLFHMANIAAGIRSIDENCSESSQLFNQRMPLCRRARFARLRNRNVRWWTSQLEGANNDIEVMFSLLLCLTWGSSNALMKLMDIINSLLKNMNKESWHKLYSSLSTAINIRQSNNGSSISFEIKRLPKNLSLRTVVALSTRGKSMFVKQLFDKYLRVYKGSDAIVLGHCQRIAYRLIRETPTADTWERNLPIIERAYSKGVMHESYFLHSLLEKGKRTEIPKRIAEKTMQKAEKYPIPLINAAEMSCRRSISSKITPVAKIAKCEKWFISE